MKQSWMGRCTAVLCAAATAAAMGNLPVIAAGENIITNGTFDSGSAGWSVYNKGEASSVISVTDGKLALNVTNLGDVNYAVQLYYSNVPLYQGTSYRLSYEISCTQERYVEAIIQQNSGSYQAYTWKGLTLTAEPQSYSYTFTMAAETDTAAKLVFNCGDNGEVLPEHTVYVDNVVLEQIDASELDNVAYEPSVMTNQVGYYPDAEKIAVFRDITDETSFSVVNALTEEVVYTGELYGETQNTSADETDFYGDFSSVTAEGTYYITCGELDASYPFTIGDDVYGNVFDASVKMFYLQRCGCAVSDDKFGHAACHTSLATVYGTSEQIDVSGGWHDAGDYGRYIVPAAKSVADLLLAYDANPSLYGDDLEIPESGNGIPDILDEVRYELEWMLKMQASTGGVYHKVSCADFPGYIMPEKETDALIVTPVSTTATADFCAAMAMAYEYYRGIDAAFADECLAAAEAAWAFLQANPNLIFNNPADISTGAYNDTRDGDERYWAACQMYHATGDTAYLDAISSISGSYSKSGMDWQLVGDYGNIAILTADGVDTSSSVYTTAENMLLSQANTLMAKTNQSAYSVSVTSFYWGSNMTVANSGVIMALAYTLTENNDYLIAACDQINYLLGKNPNGICYVTGYGTASPKNPHHRPSMAKNQAMPGMLVGGVNSGLDDPAAEKYLADAPPAKCYIDDMESYSTNEITIYWNSPLVYLLALTADTDTAADAIRGDVNADGVFSMTDVVMLQKWLIKEGEIIDWAAGDLSGDKRLDAVDLSLMKQMFLGR